MNFTAEKLCNMFATVCRNIYANSDKTVQYIGKRYYGSTYNAECRFSQMRADDCYYLAEQGLIDISSLPLAKEDINIYNSCMLRTFYEESLAFDMFSHNLYRNEKDKQILRCIILDNYSGTRDLFDNKELWEKLQLSVEEKRYIIQKALGYPRNLEMLLIEYFNDLTARHKNDIITILHTERAYATNLIMNERINEDFRNRVFHEIFSPENYSSLFSEIYHHTSSNDIIRTQVFNYLMQNPQTCMYGFFKSYVERLSDQEKIIICNKFYREIFSDSSSFRDFFNNCKIFGKWIRKSERILLIRKLRPKTRVKYIDEAKRKINFTPDELDQLNAITLTQRLL